MSLKTNWRRWVGVGISVACLIAALWEIDLAQTGAVFGNIHPGFLTLSAGAVLLTLLGKALRWKILMRPGHPAGFWRCFNILNVGILLNSIFPARMGDLARVMYLSESSKEHAAYLLGTVILEKIWDGTALLLTAVFLGWTIQLPDWLFGPMRGLGFAILAGFAVLAGIYWQRGWISKRITPDHWPGKMAHWLIDQIEMVAMNLERVKDPRILVPFTGLTVVIVFLGALTNYLAFQAFGLPLSWIPALFLLVVLMAGVSVPSVPGRFGVFHYLTLSALAIFGIGKDQGLIFGVILHLVTYLPTVLLGAFGLLSEKIPWQWLTRRNIVTLGEIQSKNE